MSSSGSGCSIRSRSNSSSSARCSRVAARVGGVRVDLEQDVAEPLAHGADRLDVVPGLDLELDAAVAVVEVALDGAQELGHVLVDADRDTAVDLGANGAEVLAERDSRAQLGVEDRHLERALRHGMTAHALQRRRDLVRGDVAAREQSRQQVIAITSWAPPTYSEE